MVFKPELSASESVSCSCLWLIFISGRVVSHGRVEMLCSKRMGGDFFHFLGRGIFLLVSTQYLNHTLYLKKKYI